MPKDKDSAPFSPVRKIRVFRNGDPYHQGIRVIVSSREILDLSLLLQLLSEKIQLPFGAKRLFTTSGRPIKKGSEIEDGKDYVASSNIFTPLNYGGNRKSVPVKNRVSRSVDREEGTNKKRRARKGAESASVAPKPLAVVAKPAKEEQKAIKKEKIKKEKSEKKKKEGNNKENGEKEAIKEEKNKKESREKKHGREVISASTPLGDVVVLAATPAHSRQGGRETRDGGDADGQRRRNSTEGEETTEKADIRAPSRRSLRRSSADAKDERVSDEGESDDERKGEDAEEDGNVSDVSHDSVESRIPSPIHLETKRDSTANGETQAEKEAKKEDVSEKEEKSVESKEKRRKSLYPNWGDLNSFTKNIEGLLRVKK